MSDKRQKNRDTPASPTDGRSDASLAEGRGSEATMAKRGTESPASTERLLEEVCAQENLKQALKRVQVNKGSPGVDGMTVDELPVYLAKHWPTHRDQLFEGTYQPQPVKRVDIPKPGGGSRRLGIPTVLDRFVQQAVMQVLQRRWDHTFSKSSFGFRPERSAHQAVALAQSFIAAGHRWVVDIDLEKFFDRVNHDIMMARIARRVSDRRLLKLIRAFLNSGVMENGLVGPTDEGTPQGGPLSPLLSNLLLDEFDRELEQRGLKFARYADDCNIYVRSERAGLRVMASVTRWLSTRLKLKVNQDKSAVARPWERKFLGFSFTADPEPKRRISPQARDRFKTRIREITQRTRGRSISQVVGELTRYLYGWTGYYRFTQDDPINLRNMDGWVHRRMRMLYWKQWKTARRRKVELLTRGVSTKLAAKASSSSMGAWSMARHPAVHRALGTAYFVSLRIPLIAAR